jgi:predicted dehydrogenase
MTEPLASRVFQSETGKALAVAVVGCGYWGPNLIRNFHLFRGTKLQWICDLNGERLRAVGAGYPGVQITTDFHQVLDDPELDAVAVATPVSGHYPIARAALERGKHVLLEKPLALSMAQGRELVEQADRSGLRLMCDHTFCYTSAVRKIREVVQQGDLGELLYFDSIRVNLGQFQDDCNVVWDLATHDLSIIDFVVDRKPVSVSVHGVSHGGNGLASMAYLSLNFDDVFIAHIHVNWLSPVKVRMTMIGGREKMLVWDDLQQSEKIKIYDKGIDVDRTRHEEKTRRLISYRSGDMHSPRISQTEALALVVQEFAAAIQEQRKPLTDGASALRVLAILEAADRSIKTHGANIPIEA